MKERTGRKDEANSCCFSLEESTVHNGATVLAIGRRRF